jgi:arsenate reductase (thioredoxin)
MDKKTVLFLCTGNSARSQLAEALVNHDLGQSWQAYSAGTQPTGYVHPMAIRVLEEIGVKHQGRSKSTDEFRDQIFDVVITVCDDAAENCPIWLGKGKKVHIGFADPAKISGDEDDVLMAFRNTRALIRKQIEDFLKENF